ncbi:hypothetical protein [Saccharomonospora piscinae]|uniref:hypothetical protein n=1 Tax=Saccharomonospora piscinae TaxID=687388 RepID=UPI0004B8BBB0
MPSALLPSPARAVPVLAIVVCRAGRGGSPSVITALRRGSVRPRHVLVVTVPHSEPHAEPEASPGGTDDADGSEAVVAVAAGTGDAELVAHAVRHARARWGDVGDWLWLVRDDRVPEPDCLAALLRVAEHVPSATALAPRLGTDSDAGALLDGTLLATATFDAEGVPDPQLCVPDARMRRSVSASGAREDAAPVAWIAPALLGAALAVVALVVHAGRLSLDLAGGALLPVGDLGAVWDGYLAAWHGVAGGTASGAPAALAVLGVLGAPLAPLGGPQTLVALLLLGGVPLAGLSAYAAARRLEPRRCRRWSRAALAAAYALLPPATAAAAQGRVEVVVVHVLLPLLVAGIVAVAHDVPHPRWLSISAACALGTAVAASFAPLLLLVVPAGAVLLFLVAPRPAADRPRARAGSLAVLVLVPPALLLPWLPALVRGPALVLHGVNGPATAEPGVVELFGLDPGGPGAVPVGVVVLLAAVVAMLIRPSARLLLPGALVALGVVSTAVVTWVEVTPARGGEPMPGFAGVPLLIVGTGLLLCVGLAMSPTSTSTSMPMPTPTPSLRSVPVALGLLALLTGAVFAGQDGPLGQARSPLPGALHADLAGSARAVLVLGDPDVVGAAPRLSTGRPPRFGDDGLVATPAAAARLATWQEQLRSGSSEAVTSALTSAAASGVLAVVLPEGHDGRELRARAGDLVAEAPPTGDGRAVLRLTPTAGTATLISSEQARRSVSGRTPDPELMTPPAAVAVDAAPPDIGVRVSEGPEGRLLVIAAAHEPGWRATVDGEPAPIVLAWDSQIAVAVGPETAEVTVVFDRNRRDLLLLGQLAVVLFTVLTAAPSVRRARGSSAAVSHRR